MGYMVGPDKDHPSPALRRLDHLICDVPNIDEALELFHHQLGFPIAWPIGRFWPGARTCGVALGGINLEFTEPDQGKPERATITTMAFEPTSLEAAEAELTHRQIVYQKFEKIEPDPMLLALRGFPAVATSMPQLICTNLMPEPPTEPPMFICDYSPFLKERLAPDNPSLKAPFRRVLSVIVELPNPWMVWRSIKELGYLGRIEIEGIQGETPLISAIKMETGPIDLRSYPANFRFI